MHVMVVVVVVGFDRRNQDTPRKSTVGIVVAVAVAGVADDSGLVVDMDSLLGILYCCNVG